MNAKQGRGQVSPLLVTVHLFFKSMTPALSGAMAEDS